MPLAGQRVGTAGGFDDNFRPDHAGFDMNGGNFGHADADLISPEPAALLAGDRLFADLNKGWKNKIASGPPTGLERFNGHGAIRNPAFRTRKGNI